MENTQKRINPLVNYNFLYYIFFGWTYSIFNIGYKRDLHLDDLYEPLFEHSAAKLGEVLSKKWEQLLHQGRPSLLKTILQCFKWRIIAGFVGLFITECIIRVAQPLLLGELISCFTHRDARSTKDMYLYAGGVVLCSLIHVFIFHSCSLSVVHLCMKYRIGCCALIYRKALRLSKYALAQTTVGEIVNLLSNDVARFDNTQIFIYYLVVAPLQMLVVAVLIWIKIGPSALVGILFLLLVIPFQIWMGKKVLILRKKSAKMTDNRLRLMNEIILGIHVIKMYTWEIPFNKMMEIIRRKEINYIKYTSFIRGIILSFGMFNVRFAIFCSLMTYALLGNEINAANVFMIVAFYGTLKQSLTASFPLAITMMAEVFVSIDRIQNFLLYKEIDDNKLRHSSDSDLGDELETFNGTADQSDDDETTISFLGKDQFQVSKIKWDRPILERQNLSYESDTDIGKLFYTKTESPESLSVENPITIRNVSVKWLNNNADYTLKSINMSVKPGSLVAIVGAVGSGKSSLFYTILNEISNLTGLLRINGTISYASQEPWLFNSSIAKNIIFGATKEDQRYKEVLRRCALNKDILLLPNGDETIVGERGVTLSGGQKARINLARAVYREADIYLLDDPLSAVDIAVGRQIFEDCIVNYLNGKTRLFITHQPQYLKEVDHIIVLDEGYMVAEGKYNYLLKTNAHFKNIIQSQRENNESTIHEEICIEENLQSSKAKEAEAESLTKTYSKEKLIDEKTRKGAIGANVYKSYIIACGSSIFFLILLSFISLSQFLASGSDAWISRWVNIEEYDFVNKDTSYNGTIKNYTMDLSILPLNNTDTANDTVEYDEITISSSDYETRSFYAISYTVLIVTLIFATLSRSLMFFWMATKASMNLHNEMFKVISHSIMRFFHTNPSGRILNRFSQDIGTIDEVLPIATMNVIQTSQQMIGIFIVIIFINPWLILPTTFMFIIFAMLRTYYIHTSRSLKRLEGIARSPIFSHLSATLQGITTIRALGAQEIAIDEYNYNQDTHSSVWFMNIGTARALGLWLDSGCVVFIALITLTFIFFENLSGNIGLGITQAISLIGMIQYGIRQFTDMENYMTCVERVIEYHDIEQEHPLTTERDKRLKTWPEEGHIQFNNVCLSYSPKGPLVLQNISFKIQSREKLGIVGRTASGKTSIINALFRMAFVEGTIEIDGIQTDKIGLTLLRSKISIIPQDPILFSGNVRQNIDPFNQHSDEILWRVLEQVELKNHISSLPEGLDTVMAEGGSNFSIGQRQLFCLARAIVFKNKILVLDEATANIDPQTDKLIQTTIKEYFADCTVITIAHRLATIMDSDKILVMDEGKIIEFEHPFILLSNKGAFYNMVQQTSDDMSLDLEAIARESYEAKINNK